MGKPPAYAPTTTDAALLNNRVGEAASLVRLARATLADIHQNVGAHFGLTGLFLITTITGVTAL